MCQKEEEMDMHRPKKEILKTYTKDSVPLLGL